MVRERRRTIFIKTLLVSLNISSNLDILSTISSAISIILTLLLSVIVNSEQSYLDYVASRLKLVKYHFSHFDI